MGTGIRAVINENSGAVLEVFQDLGGADEVWFNPGDGHYFIPSCNTAMPHCSRDWSSLVTSYSGSSTQTHSSWTNRFLIAEQNSDTTVTTGNPRTTHSVAADPSNNQIYPADPGSWRYCTAVRPDRFAIRLALQ